MTRWLRMAASGLLMIVLYFVLPVAPGASFDFIARSLLTTAILAGLAVLLAVQMRLHIDDLSRRVDGLVAALMLVVVVFAFVFYSMSVHQPGQLVGVVTRIDALYFTMTTLTTVGYGDIHAEGQAGRALVLVEMVFNVVFVAALAGLLSERLKLAGEHRRTSRSGVDPAVHREETSS